MAKEIIKTNLKLSDKILLKYNDREVDMSLSDFKTFLDANLEPSNAVLTSNEPLKYKALISQNAPIAAGSSGDMIAGQIWTLTNIADPAIYYFLDSLELMSGILYASGSKYRSNIDVSFSFPLFIGNNMEYDGAPYIVSTDVNGDFNPFINTLGENPVFTYDSTGNYFISTTSSITRKKKMVSIESSTGISKETYVDDNTHYLFTFSSDFTTEADDILNYSPISIEVYP